MSLFKYRKTRDNIEFSKNRILSSVRKEERAITLIALVITIVLNSSYLAMERKNRKEANKLKI